MTNLTYLFEIILVNEKKFHFTSSSEYQTINNVHYVPQSGLNFNIAEFNDSAENIVSILGIFEDNGGINKDENLAGARVKINYLYGNNVHLIGNFIVTKFLSQDLEFELKCETELLKYNQPLLQMFSKTCRANFGDNKCKINLNDVSVHCQINEINGNMITCDFFDVEDGHFKGGKMIITDTNNFVSEFKIISHVRNTIEINSAINPTFYLHHKIVLIPGCDKNYRTCCYSFNNAVNFRGEPAIPEFNIIEN